MSNNTQLGLVVYAEGNGFTVSGSTITNNDAGCFIELSGITGFEIHDSEITGNARYALGSDLAETVDATLNWWGDASGPQHISNLAGNGDIISDGITYAPWYIDEARTTLTPVYNVTSGTYHHSIQTGINAADPSDSITVADGTYVENITVPVERLTLKSTTLHEANIEGLVTILADGVTLEGFDILGSVKVGGGGHGYGDVTVAYNKITTDGSNGICYSHGSSSGGTVTHNVVSAPGKMGICLDHDGGTFIVTHNTVEARKAIMFGTLSGGVIKYNTISSPSSDCDIEVWDASIVTAHYNNLAGEVWNSDNPDKAWTVGDTLDATLNWWGNPNGPSAVSGDVNYSPWLPGEWELFFDTEGNLIHSDNDGFSDLEEYWLGTDPTDPESCPGAPVGEVDTAYVEGDEPGEVTLEDSAGTIVDVDISDAPEGASGTITGARYTEDPSDAGLSVGTGTTGVAFLDVKVTGYTSGTARITVPYLDEEQPPEVGWPIGDGIVDGTDILEHTLSLYYWDTTVSPAVWRLAANNEVDWRENNVSGDIPISALTGTPVSMGGYLPDEATVAIESIVNLSNRSDGTVELTINTNTAFLGSATIDLMFDPRVVEVLGFVENAVNGKDSAFDTLTFNPEYGFMGNDTQIARFLAYQSDKSGEGVDATGGVVVAVVKLQAVGSTMDVSPLHLEVVTLKDNKVKGDWIPCTFWDRSFALVGGVGDANRDTYVDSNDLPEITFSILGFSDVDTPTMNVDAKDEVDAADCTYLALHLAGVSDRPLPPDGWISPWGPWPPAPKPAP